MAKGRPGSLPGRPFLLVAAPHTRSLRPSLRPTGGPLRPLRGPLHRFRYARRGKRSTNLVVPTGWIRRLPVGAALRRQRAARRPPDQGPFVAGPNPRHERHARGSAIGDRGRIVELSLSLSG